MADNTNTKISQNKNDKIKCGLCDGTYLPCNKAHHEKTKKHIAMMTQIQKSAKLVDNKMNINVNNNIEEKEKKKGDRRGEKIKCEFCDVEYSLHNKSHHEKTKNHMIMKFRQNETVLNNKIKSMEKEKNDTTKKTDEEKKEIIYSANNEKKMINKLKKKLMNVLGEIDIK